MTTKDEKELEKKKKEEEEKKKAEEEEAKKKQEEEEEKRRKEEEKSGKGKDLIVCNRCGFKYKTEETVTREQQKCCPECLAPQEWK